MEYAGKARKSTLLARFAKGIIAGLANSIIVSLVTVKALAASSSVIELLQ